MNGRGSLFGAVLTSALLSAGCMYKYGPESFAALHARQQSEVRRLSRLLVANQQVRQELHDAEHELRRVECRAEAAKLEAEAATRSATCSREHAESLQCLANVAKAQADTTLLGCLMGIGLAMISGGAGAPVALLACAGSRALADSDDVCSVPKCDPSDSASWALVLRDHGLKTTPTCGGVVGASLQFASVRGVLVEQARAGSDAQMMGVIPGDVLVRIGERWVAHPYEVAAAFSQIPLHAPIDVVLSRNGQLVHRRGVRNNSDLGVEDAGATTVREGALVISRVDSASAAAEAGLRVGDVLTHVEGRPLVNIEQVRRVIRLLDEGAHVGFRVERGGVPLQRYVILAARGDRDAL